MQHYPGILPRFGERLLRKLWRLDKGRNIKGTTKGWLDDFLNAAFTLGYALKGRGEITLSSYCIFTIYRQHNISIGRWTFQRQAFHYMRVVMFGAVPTVPPIAPKMEKKSVSRGFWDFLLPIFRGSHAAASFGEPLWCSQAITEGSGHGSVRYFKKMLAQKALLSENIWTWLKHWGTHVPNWAVTKALLDWLSMVFLICFLNGSNTEIFLGACTAQDIKEYPLVI